MIVSQSSPRSGATLVKPAFIIASVIAFLALVTFVSRFAAQPVLESMRPIAGTSLRGWSAAVKVTIDSPGALAYVGGTAACMLAALTLVWDTRFWPAAAVLSVLPVVVLSTVSGVLIPLTAASLLILASAAMGELICRGRLTSLGSAEHVLVVTGLGLGVICIVALGLGSVGGLRWWAVGPAALVMIAVAGHDVLRSLRARRSVPQVQRPRVAMLLLPAVAAVLIAVQAVAPYVVAPDLTYDATAAHLVIAREFATRGSTAAMPEQLGSYFPALAQVSYALATLFSSIDSAKFVHFFVGLLTAGAVFATARRLAGVAAGLLAAALWLSIPLVLWEMSTAYVDLFGTLYSSLSVLTALAWVETRQTRFGLLTGVMIGFGLGVKMNLGLTGAAVFVAVAMAGVRSRQDARVWLMSAVLAALVGAPWYLRAYLMTGNPIFPILNGVFKSSQWYPVNENFNFSTFGMGTQTSDWLRLPWRLTIATSRFAELPDGSLGLFPLLVGATLIVSPLLVRLDRRVVLLWVFTLVGTLLCFGYVQYARYLLPVFPAAAGLAGATLVGVFQRVLGRAAGAAIVSGSASALVFIALPLLIPMQWKVPTTVPWAVDLGLQSRQRYLGEGFREVTAFRWIEQNLESDAPPNVLAVGYSDAPFAYSGARIYLGQQTYLGRQVLSARDPQEVLRVLHDNEIKYVLFDLFPKPTIWASSYVLASDRFKADHMKLLFASNYVYLYAVTDTPPATVPGPAVLSDPNLRSLASASPAWESFGTAAAQADQSSCAGAHLSGPHGYVQRFPVQPNALYTIVQVMGPEQSGGLAYGKMQVNWLGTNGRTDIEIDTLTNQASPYTMNSTSPPDAVEGIIYVSAFGDAPVCVESVHVYGPGS
jgi:hypothetical protein